MNPRKTEDKSKRSDTQPTSTRRSSFTAFGLKPRHSVIKMNRTQCSFNSSVQREMISSVNTVSAGLVV